MKKLVIDGSRTDGRESLFASLKEQLQDEGFIGSNLDALYDVLTQKAEPVEIEIRSLDALRGSLGDYTDRLLRVLADYGAFCAKERGEDNSE